MKKIFAITAIAALALAGCSGSPESNSDLPTDSTYQSSNDSSTDPEDSSNDSDSSNFGYRYPDSERADLLNSCSSTSNGEDDYCICTLEALERTYSWDELTNLMSQDGGLEEIQSFALKECSWAIR